MTAPPLWQTVAFAVCASLAIILEVAVDPGLALQLGLLAPLVAVLGLPHGGLDLPIAEVLWPLRGWRGKLRFFAIYLGLVAGVIAVWAVLPGIALAGFLAYSALHFSGDWARAATPLRWTGGVATIGAPALLHTTEVSALFAHLAPTPAAGLSATIAAVAGGLALGVLMAILILKPRARGQAAVEQIILWITAFVLPPLLFFVVYFCSLHSLRHFDAAIRSVPSAGRALVMASGLSGLVTVAALIFVLAMDAVELSAGPQSPLQAIFIGLAALTVPHMLLVERFNHQHPLRV